MVNPPPPARRPLYHHVRELIRVFRSTTLVRYGLVTFSIGAAAAIQPAPLVGGNLKPFTARDILQITSISGVQFSPRGNSAAIIVQRALNGEHWKSGYAPGVFRGDLYIEETSSGRIQRVSDGAQTGTDYEEPQWSRDGRFVACRATDHDGLVRIAVFDTLHRVWHNAPFQTNFVWYMPYLAWTGGDRLVIGAEGLSPPLGFNEFSGLEEEMKMLPGLLSGKVPTSIDYSSSSRTAGYIRGGEVLLWDPLGDRTRRIFNSYATDLALSPNGKWLAAAVPNGLMTFDPSSSVTAMDRRNFELYMINVQSGRSWPTRLQVDYRSGVLRWNANGTEVATIARLGASMNDQQYVFRCFMGKQRCLPVMEGLKPVRAVVPTHMGTGDNRSEGFTQFVYANDDSRLIYSSILQGRWGWWIVGNGMPRPLTLSSKLVPALVFYDRATRAIIAAAGRDLWILPRGAPRFRLVRAFPVDIHILLPSDPSDGLAVNGAVSLTVGSIPGYTRVGLANFSETTITPPSPTARLLSRDESQQKSAWLTVGTGGQQLWIRRRSGYFAPTLHLDGFLLDRELPVCTSFHYRDRLGQDLVGVVSKPRNVEGPLPAIVWVYDGSVIPNPQPGSESCGITENDPTLANPFNLVVFASRGYAVLYPSMPVRIVKGRPSRYPYNDLLDGLMPAIKRAADLGYIDPRRLIIMGQSFGGFSTLGIISQTNVFRAAIASASPADYFLEYGVFDPLNEMDPSEPLIDITNLGFQEDGQLQAGGPPWAVPQVYLRNSPLMHLNSVRTPLLLIDGDQDFVSDLNSEQVFSGLVRLNRRVEFVRYVGQGHVLDSASDILDFWRRVLNWCGRYLSQ